MTDPHAEKVLSELSRAFDEPQRQNLPWWTSEHESVCSLAIGLLDVEGDRGEVETAIRDATRGPDYKGIRMPMVSVDINDEKAYVTFRLKTDPVLFHPYFRGSKQRMIEERDKVIEALQPYLAKEQGMPKQYMFK